MNVGAVEVVKWKMAKRTGFERLVPAWPWQSRDMDIALHCAV